MLATFTIGQLAKEVGVNVETIRYYQRRKLFPEPKRAHDRPRHYGEKDLTRLRFIKSAQRLGFTLKEVAELLAMFRPMSCSKTRPLAAAKLEAIDERIRELQTMRKEFKKLLAACDANADDSRCPIIERFAARLL